MKRKRTKNTAKSAGRSTAEGQLPDGYFLQEARTRLRAELKQVTGKKASSLEFRVVMPPELRSDGIIRQAMYRRRRGRVVEEETVKAVHAEVRRRLDNKHKDPAHRMSAHESSQQFWNDLPTDERYTRYRVVCKDHRKTIQACLEGLL